MKTASLISALVLALTATAFPLPGMAAEVQVEGEVAVLPEDMPAPPVNLNPAIEVEDAYVLLGDIFTNLKKFADKPVAYAPPPGKRTVLDARWLQTVARSYGVQWRAVSEYEKVTVTRASQIIDKVRIAEEIHAALADYDVGPTADITLNNRNLTIHVAASSDARVGVNNISYDAHSGRFMAEIEAPAGAPDAQRLRVSGRVFSTAEIPVFKRNIGKGETIKASDLEWKTLRAKEMRNDTVTLADDLIGKTPKRFVRAGVPVRAAEVQRPQLVDKGSLVTVVLNTPLMSLTTQGRALENGANGDTIRVENVRSHSVVLATVTEANQVTVEPTSAPLTN